MLDLSPDPKVAEQQLEAIVFFLATFGYIDGDFDEAERDFVRRTVREAVERRMSQAVGRVVSGETDEATARWTAHFLGIFDKVDAEIGELLAEEIARDEMRADFIFYRLKQRCFEVLQEYDPDGRDALLDLIDELVMADGQAHPAELQFRSELSDLLEADLGIALIEED